jgi:ubiquinone biosynthesis protein Coq4
MSQSTPVINADMSLSVTPELLKGLTPELLKGLRAFLSFSNNFVDIYGIFDVEVAMSQQEVFASQLAYLKSHPEIAQLFEERYLAPPQDLDELLKLPEDSLGFAYATNVRAVNYTQDIFPKVDVKDDASYYLARMRQTHDIWHTVSGYGLTVFGGLGLGAFQLSNNRDAAVVILMAGEFLNNFKMHRDLNPVIQIFLEGYAAGCQAKPFLAQKWEEAWEKPLAQWRAELNVPPLKCKNMEDAVEAASLTFGIPTFGNLSSQKLRQIV